jgi:acetyl esterase/lipase
VPGLLWIHGGGYLIGVPEQDDAYILRFVEASGCVVVSPDYTLALDKPYPAALEDCYQALLWLKQHGTEYGMRADQLFVGGDSAGGGLAAAISLYARDKGEVALAFQMLLYPMIDDRATGSSVDNNAPVWNSNDNDGAWQLYLRDAYRSDEVPMYAAPGRAEDCSGLPPAFSFVGSVEPFHDETVAFMDNLTRSGVPVHFRVFDGCFHAFDQMCSETKTAGEAVDFLMESFAYAKENYFAPQKSEQDR